MLGQLKLLTKLECINLFGWNVIRHSKDRRKKRMQMLLCAVMFLLILLGSAGMGGQAAVLVMLGMGEAVPLFMAAAVSAVLLVLNCFQAQTLYSPAGYESLCALPVSPAAVAGSRILRMYLFNLGINAVLSVPMIAVFGAALHPGAEFYGVCLLGMFLLPLFPLAVSFLLGAAMMAISARSRHKTAVQTALTLLLMVILLGGSLFLQTAPAELTEGLILDILGRGAEQLGRWIPPARWFAEAAAGSGKGLALWLAAEILPFGAAIFLLLNSFAGICRKLFSGSAVSGAKAERVQSRSMLGALCRKECRRYFSSSLYVSNTVVGPILAVILTAALLFADISPLEKILPVPAEWLVPLVWAAVCGMMTAAGVSLSMEGKHLWILQSLPIPAKTVVQSKILWNLTLILPFYLVSQVLLLVWRRPDLPQLLWQVLMPASLVIFACTAGVTSDRKLGRYDWEKEEAAVKQSASALVSMLEGPLAAVLCAVPVLVLPEAWMEWGRLLLCPLVLAVSALIYRYTVRQGLPG